MAKADVSLCHITLVPKSAPTWDWIFHVCDLVELRGLFQSSECLEDASGCQGKVDSSAYHLMTLRTSTKRHSVSFLPTKCPENTYLGDNKCIHGGHRYQQPYLPRSLSPEGEQQVSVR